MLVLGGVMEYLEKIGKTNDLKALSAAPVYGFSTAMRYINGERKRYETIPNRQRVFLISFLLEIFLS